MNPNVELGLKILGAVVVIFIIVLIAWYLYRYFTSSDSSNGFCGSVAMDPTKNMTTETPTYEQKHAYNYGIKPLYEGLDALALRLQQLNNVATMENFIPIGEAMSYINDIYDHSRKHGYKIPRNIQERLTVLELKMKDNQYTQTPGINGGTIEVYKLKYEISELICVIRGMLKNMLSLADIFGDDGQKMITDSQRLNLLKASSAGFMAGYSDDISGMDDGVQKAISDAVDFQPQLEQEKMEAQYTDNIYKVASKDGGKGHIERVNERKRVGNCTNTVGRSRIIEEEIMRSEWSGRYPKIRTCTNGVGPYTTQDAPNTALKASAVNQNSSYTGNCGACTTCFNYDATAGSCGC